MLSFSEKSAAQTAVDIHHVNLDIRVDSATRSLDKPSLAGQVTPSVKRQFKPSAGEVKALPKPKDDLNDLGIDLEPLPPVKLRMGQ